MPRRRVAPAAGEGQHESLSEEGQGHDFALPSAQCAEAAASSTPEPSRLVGFAVLMIRINSSAWGQNLIEANTKVVPSISGPQSYSL